MRTCKIRLTKSSRQNCSSTALSERLEFLRKRGYRGAGVFVINVSLGDGNRPFFGRTSAWARALDWLAHEHGILFIVSAGNASDRQHDIQMNGVASTDAFGALEGVERSKAILSGLHASVGRRRILSPAEAESTP